MFRLNHSSILMAMIFGSLKVGPIKYTNMIQYSFHSPLTPSSPKHSALGIARVIPLTAVFGGRRVQPFRELEYSYRKESIPYVH